ncbi:acetoacetate--CoA ligase [Neobacillus drentensis]|uniref:acetoacetate--CoA ligase n=1 Tax=Neobacillus drentensis TaxID=220684 RepID=UPI0030039F8F
MITEGTLMWEPSAEMKEKAQLTAYIKWLKEKKDKDFANYDELWRWSVDELENFWESIWEYFSIYSPTPYQSVIDQKIMPGAKWFPGARVNFTEQILRHVRPGKAAIHYHSETISHSVLTWDELAKKVYILAEQLRELGVQPGDRVSAYLPSIPETVIALLATASIGAVWSSCSPEFGVKSVLDRFRQIEPKVLIAVDGYQFGGKVFDKREDVKEIYENLPTVKGVIHVPYMFKDFKETPIDGALLWSQIMDQPEPQDFQFEYVPFDHPIWILYSSGTTGIPKGIVHSQGGIILETMKALGLNGDLHDESCVFFYTSTAWMVFNGLVSHLLVGSSIVLYDGNPTYPTVEKLWEIAEMTDANSFGASPTYINILNKVGFVPKQKYNLSKLNEIQLSGSPVSSENFDWIYNNVKTDLWVSSKSGGTDICSVFVTGSPITPVYAGEIQVRALGVDIHAFSEEGNSIIDEVGELVVKQPMPSMPIYFWNDPNNERYFDSYFSTYPGIWRHGDYLKITSRGTCIISGRSDSTLNRNGIRIGTSEIYSAVECLDEVQDSLIVNLDLPEGKFFMPMFVELKEGLTLEEDLKGKIRKQIKEVCSPRHIPDEIYQIESVPYTLTGKKMEVPVRKILLGVDEKKAVNRDAMKNPSSLDYFVNFKTTNILVQN